MEQGETATPKSLFSNNGSRTRAEDAVARCHRVRHRVDTRNGLPEDK